MNYAFKKLMFKLSIVCIVLFCAGIYAFFVSDDADIHGNLVHFHNDVKNGDVIFRTTSFRETDVGIIEMGMFRKVYVWDNHNTMKQELYEWAKKSEDGHVAVYRIVSPDVKADEINPLEIDSLMHWHKLEFITAN